MPAQTRSTVTDRLILGALIAAGVGFGAVLHDVFRDRVVQVGDTAPEFQVVANNGSTVTRGNYGGKVLILNFWASWCAPCVRETPALEELHRNLRDAGVVVLGISVDKHEKKYREFLKRFNVTFLTAHDPGKIVGDSYGTYRYPETYVIDRNGKVVQKIIGAEWTVEEMTRFVKTLL